MSKRILTKFIAVLLCALLVVTQQITGIVPAKAAPTDYYSPYDVAYSPDGTMIAVSDATKSALDIITASTGTIARTIPLNGTPKGIEWKDSTLVYVAEYGAGTVAEVNATNGTIPRRFTTGRYPTSVAVYATGNKLVVTDKGLNKLTVVDLSAGTVLGDVALNYAPEFVDITTDGTYAVVAHATPNGSAWVNNYASSVTFVNIGTRTVSANVALPTGSTNLKNIKCSPDGNYVYVVHTLGRTNLPTTQVTRGWTNTNAMSIIKVSGQSYYTTVLLDTMNEGAADPWGLAISSDSTTAWISISGIHKVYKLNLSGLQGLLAGTIPGYTTSPALTYRNKSAYYPTPYSDVWFKVKASSANLALLKDDLGALWSARLLTKVALNGQGPRGISISGTTVAVGEYYAGTVETISTSTNAITKTINLGAQPAEDAQRRGDRKYHDASTTLQKWLSCATCHPEGRADGLDWDMPNDGVGNAKNTKSHLKVFETGVAMWRGIRDSAWAGVTAGFKYIKFATPTDQDITDVATYIQGMTEEPSPYRNSDNTMTSDAVAGQAIFTSAGCATCHSGVNFTDKAKHDVGTKDSTDIDGQYVTPPLVELWKSAPYLHDGSAATLMDVITTKNPSNLHGTTSTLTTTQKQQLVAYLQQLEATGSDTKDPSPTPTVAAYTPTPTPQPAAYQFTGGTIFGTSPPYAAGYEYTKAFDGNTSTFFDYSQAENGYAGIDYGAGSTKVLTRVSLYPRGGYEGRMQGARIQGSNTSPTSGFVDLLTVVGCKAGWNDLPVVNSTPYRYYRFYSGCTDAFCDVAEVQFWGFDPNSTPPPTPTPTPTPYPNLALNKTTNADSSQSGNGSANAVDGNMGTRWCANDGNLNHWWYVDLGSNQTISKVETTFESSGYAYQYKLEGSTDNTNWTMLKDKTTNTDITQTQVDTFTSTSKRYVRITITGLGSGRWASFWEFVVRQQ